jgi:hypothetical protein
MRTDRAVNHDHLQTVSNDKIGSLSTTLSADKMNRCDRVWHSPWDLDSKQQFSDCGAKNCNDRYNLGIEYLRTRLRFPRIINWRRFSTSHRHGSPGESELRLRRAKFFAVDKITSIREAPRGLSRP